MAITERHAREILQKQYDRQNAFAKEKYDRIAVFVPKGMRDTIKETAKRKGFASVNAYVVSLIENDLSIEDPDRVAADPGSDRQSV